MRNRTPNPIEQEIEELLKDFGNTFMSEIYDKKYGRYDVFDEDKTRKTLREFVKFVIKHTK